MKKLNIVYISLFALFFIAGIVLLVITLGVINLTEFNPLYTMLAGYTQLRYYELFLTASMLSFASSICFLIIWAISKFTNADRKITVSLAVIIAIVFCSVLISKGINAYSNYCEKSVYTDIFKVYEKPDDNVMEFFPNFDDITNSTATDPYYSLSECSLNNSVLRTSQIFNDIADENGSRIAITIDYFKSDKYYLMSKYKSEKLLYEITDENGNELKSSEIKKQNYKNNECLIILLDTEKRLIIKGSDFYFSAIVQDDINILDIDEKEFVDFAKKQFELMSDTKIFEDMPSV